MPKLKPIVPLLISIALFAMLVFLVSCGSNPSDATIQDVKPVDVKPVKESVVIVKQYTNDARKEIALAKREAEEARLDAEEAKALVERMKEAESPYADKVAELRSSYEDRIKALSAHIKETDRILGEQGIKLDEADRQLDIALEQAAVANQSNELLIASNKKLQEKADAADKYKEHWDTRWERKIKTIAWSIGGTILSFVGLFIWQRFSPSGLAASYAGSLLSRR